MARTALWTGIVCPQQPLQALLRLLPGASFEAEPLAIHELQRGRSLVVETNRAARMLGVRIGQRLADALAVAPALHTLTRDHAAEQQLLEEIALSAYRYSHQVAISGNGVVLEVGGSCRLHGRLETLLEALDAELNSLGLKLWRGTAPVAAAASLMARAQLQVLTLTELEACLRNWPLKRLMLPTDEYSRLERLGLKRLSELLALPRFEFERRLGRGLLLHIDRLLGRAPTPLKYWQPPEIFRQKIELPVPTHRSDALLFALNRVLMQLQRWLQLRDRALTGLKVELHPEDPGRCSELHAGLSQPGFQRDKLLEILRLKLEPLKLDANIGSLVVQADSTNSFRPPQADLWGESPTGDSWEALLDRLQARVGTENLCSITPCPDHRPERSWRWSEPGTSTVSAAFPERPGWLLPKPRPCKINELRLIDGPERIESGWWDGHDCRRDYWIAHDRHGNRLWIFREYKPRTGWFVHGLFG